MSRNIFGFAWVQAASVRARRACVPVRVAGTAVGVGVWAWCASAAIIPFGQSRAVAIRANADDPFTPGAASAFDQRSTNDPGDFLYTNQIVAEQPPVVAIARGEQSSIIDRDFIGGHGFVELYAGATQAGGIAGAGSVNTLEVGFEIDVPTEIVFAGQVGMDGEASILLRSQAATIRLVQGSFVQREFRGTLEPGNYFLTALIDYGVFSTGGPEQFGFDRWDFQLSVVPEPPAICVMVCAGMFAGRRRR